MITSIVDACFRRPAVALLLAAAATITGALAFTELRRDVFPDLSAPLFNVIVQNASMGTEELETAIAIPMEVELAGLPVRRLCRGRRWIDDRHDSSSSLSSLAAPARRGRTSP